VLVKRQMQLVGLHATLQECPLWLGHVLKTMGGVPQGQAHIWGHSGYKGQWYPRLV